MKALYTAKVRAEGGRNGFIASEDGLLKENLALPKSMGGTEDATNPEQLFAGGYAACFLSSIEFAAKRDGQQLQGTAVNATVTLSPTEAGPFTLGVTLDVEVGGLAQADAEALLAEAHQSCPFSNAARGNIDVRIETRAV